MSYKIILTGVAGSGKTTFTNVLCNLLRQRNYDVVCVNLDPGADKVPYSNDIDVRTIVSARDVMKKYGLGPNGAILASMDLLLAKSELLMEMVGLHGDVDFMVIDTPGQMEVFAFREVGKYVLKLLCEEGFCVNIFLLDVYTALSPIYYASYVFLAESVRIRLGIPQVNVLNKVDLLEPEDRKRLETWVEEPFSVLASMPPEAEFVTNLYEAVISTGVFSPPILASAKTLEGVDKVYSIMLQHLTGGDEVDIRTEPREEDFFRHSG